MGLFGSASKKSMEWESLDSINYLDELDLVSEDKFVLLFKHSTRCSVSVMAKRRLETEWDLSNEQIIPVYLDLLKHRDVSNEIANRYGVTHQSPQVLLIKDGISHYDVSHNMISVEELKKYL